MNDMKEDIFYCIEHSQISKETLKEHLEKISVRATRICEPGEFFEGRNPRYVTFCWFKNWLHPVLKHRTEEPIMPHYKYRTEENMKVYWEQYNKRFYENGQHNFDYTLEDIEKYIYG